MANITFDIEDAQLRNVQAIAAQHETSLTALIQGFLSHLVASGLQDTETMNGNLQVLFDYSAGRISRRTARSSLGVDDGVLTIMLRQAGFPPPRASQQEEDRMLDEIKHIHFTAGAIPHELLARAQIDAAAQGMTVDALIQALLEGHLARAQVALPGNYEILVGVALGQVALDSAAKQLHLDCEEDLFLLLTYCGLPRPRISQAQEARMRERLATLFDLLPATERTLAADLADGILSTGPASAASSGLFLAASEATLAVLRESLPRELAGRGAIVLYTRLSQNADPGDAICAALRGELARHEGAAARLGGLDNVGLGRGVTLTAALSGLSLHTGKIIALVIDDAHHITSTQNGIDAMFALKAARDALNLDRALHGLRFVAMSPYADKLAKLRNASDQAFFLAPLLVFEGKTSRAHPAG